MKIISKQQAFERKNSDLCVVTEYPILDEAIDFAIVNIKGKYPHEKNAVNQNCKEIVYVQQGNGEVIINGKQHLIDAGDVVLIEPGEKFIWKGNMTLHISCRPAFTVDQHQLVD